MDRCRILFVRHLLFFLFFIEVIVMKSVMQHTFSQVPRAEIPRSSFDRSCGYKTTFDPGYLVPFLVDEALPGDTFNCKTAAFVRMATPIYPVMDNIFLETFYFAVPYRLVWTNFVKMMGEQTNPGDSTDFLVPIADVTKAPLSTTGYTEQSLQDYMGLPTKVAALVHTNLLPRAYNLIYNTWFRDENLQNSVQVDTGDGPDDPSKYVLLRRGKRYDYFTSCLPWPQKGPAVGVPLGTTAPVVLSGTNAADLVRKASDGTLAGTLAGFQSTAASHFQSTAGAVDLFLDPNGTLSVDLTNATASTINQLRQAFQIQKMYERDARGGTRYTELVRSHFGVTSPDARLQRPEYLGGGSSKINVHTVASTAGTTDVGSDGRGLGDVAAMVTGAFVNHGFVKSFTEHCLIIGLMNVRADLSYQQGLNKMWTRRDRLDFYWPALAHIGEQAVLNKEIYCKADGNDDLVFGYQERFAEYRYKPSQVTGQFRSNSATPLDSWHLSQYFSSLPVLGDTFIKDTPPISRVLRVSERTGPSFIGDFYHQMRCARPMPLFGVPGNIDRF